MLYQNILSAIGKTPLVKIQTLSPSRDVEIFVKLEGTNPGGSVKDRVAWYLITEAEKRGQLARDRVLIEATSGNTGIGLAMVAALKGYRFTAVLPENVSPERRKMLELFGAKVILSPASEGSNGAVLKVRKIVEEDQRYVMLDQYNNLANVLAHYETTGEEILADLPKIDYFVAGMGTGGTLTGVGRRLKDYNLKIKIVGVEPGDGETIPGLRNMTKYRPFIFQEIYLTDKVQVSGREAVEMTRKIFVKEGLSVGISSGAAMVGALRTTEKIKRGKIVVLFPDRGDRYLSVFPI